jgi:chromate transporter
VTFELCFAFVFLGAPLVERLEANRTLSAALSAMTASIVGVVANLAVWFALHALFKATFPVRTSHLSFDAPVPSSIDLWALLLAVIAAIAVLRMKLDVVRTLGVCAVLGVVLHMAVVVGQ